MITEQLARVFAGGRISGWVERNRHVLETGDFVPEEIARLEKLSPSFAKNTQGMTVEQKALLAMGALMLADKSPLSATHY